MAMGFVSSGTTVSRDDATDSGTEMVCGEMGVGRTVETSEGDVVEVPTESRDDMCRKRGSESLPIFGALARTGVRRGRNGDKTRIIEGGFERSSFVTMSAAGAKLKPLPTDLFEELEVLVRLDPV